MTKLSHCKYKLLTYVVNMEISKPIKSKKTRLKKTPYTPKGYLIYYLVLWTIVLSIAFTMSK